MIFIVVLIEVYANINSQLVGCRKDSTTILKEEGGSACILNFLWSIVYFESVIFGNILLN